MRAEVAFDILLAQGLKQIHLSSICEPLAQYLHLLHQWNTAYNLTAVRCPQEMVNKHILDSLAILPWIRGQSVLDVGTGAGLPGIPLAIARPDLSFVLLDSNGKKIRFLKEVKRQLQINNVELVQIRAENYLQAQGFDTVVSRAFSSLEDMIHWTKHLVAPGGLWLAMKGRYPDAELKTLSLPYEVQHYTVEGIEGERCCVLIDNLTKE